MDVSNLQVREAILLLIAFIISVTVHEFGHAWAATKLGDALPRLQGRLTLSPKAHADLIGTIVAPLLTFFVGGGGWFGWGKPVQTNPSSYTRKIGRATGSMLVAVAGPAMNLALATLASIGVIVAIKAGVSPELGAEIIKRLVALNLMLLFFNLLPIPPLDGGAVLAWALPRSMQPAVDFLQRWGFTILLGLMLIGGLSFIMQPAFYVANLWSHTVLRIALS